MIRLPQPGITMNLNCIVPRRQQFQFGDIKSSKIAMWLHS